jgi:hypothetical protein
MIIVFRKKEGCLFLTKELLKTLELLKEGLKCLLRPLFFINGIPVN